MMKHGDIITLSPKEAQGFIDKECQKRLGISTKEFLAKRQQNALPESKSAAVHDIDVLLRLVSKK